MPALGRSRPLGSGMTTARDDSTANRNDTVESSRRVRPGGPAGGRSHLAAPHDPS